jgi:hypothetical protein
VLEVAQNGLPATPGPFGRPSPPSQAIGGRPKKRGRQAYFDYATPPPPANRNGGGGRISREKPKVSIVSGAIWRRGGGAWGAWPGRLDAKVISHRNEPVRITRPILSAFAAMICVSSASDFSRSHSLGNERVFPRFARFDRGRLEDGLGVWYRGWWQIPPGVFPEGHPLRPPIGNS